MYPNSSAVTKEQQSLVVSARKSLVKLFVHIQVKYNLYRTLVSYFLFFISLTGYMGLASPFVLHTVSCHTVDLPVS
jgi:hypothetical protein